MVFFGETSINEKNVAMSATESVYGNPRALAYDPWIKKWLGRRFIARYGGSIYRFCTRWC